MGRLFGRRGSSRLCLLAAHEDFVERRAGIEDVIMCGTDVRIGRKGVKLDMAHEQDGLGMGRSAR